MTLRNLLMLEGGSDVDIADDQVEIAIDALQVTNSAILVLPPLVPRIERERDQHTGYDDEKLRAEPPEASPPAGIFHDCRKVRSE